jgi:hypothetical protein
MDNGRNKGELQRQYQKQHQGTTSRDNTKRQHQEGLERYQGMLVKKIKGYTETWRDTPLYVYHFHFFVGLVFPLR